MNRFIFSLLSLCALAACKDDPENRVISQHVSPDGHAFTVMPILEDGVSDITIAAAWRNTWVMGADANPWAPLIAAQVMLTGGTKDLENVEVLELFDKHGSYGDIAIAYDAIYAEVEFPNHKEDVIMPVLAEMFQTPQFDEKWIERERAAILERLTAEEQPIGIEIWEAARYAILGDGPQFQILNQRDRASLAALTRDDLLAWHEAILSRSPTSIIVTGGIKSEDAGRLVDRLFPAPTPPLPDPAPLQSADFSPKVIYLHRPDAEKSVIGMLGPLPETTDGLDWLDVALFHVFAGGAGSPLFDRIRTDLGATYGMSMGPANYSRSQRVMFITGEVDTTKMADARAAILEAYAAFRADPDLSQLGDVGKRLADSTRDTLKYVNTSARTIRELDLDGLDLERYRTQPEMLETVSDDQARDRLQTAFPRADQLSIFAAGPDPYSFPDACVITTTAQAVDC